MKSTCHSFSLLILTTMILLPVSGLAFDQQPEEKVIGIRVPLIDIDLGGNININNDYMGEDCAKQATALAVEQFKYTRFVTMEGKIIPMIFNR